MLTPLAGSQSSQFRAFTYHEHLSAGVGIRRLRVRGGLYEAEVQWEESPSTSLHHQRLEGPGEIGVGERAPDCGLLLRGLSLPH